MKYETKKGRFGTLYRFVITYTDAYDRGFGEARTQVWAYDAEGAEEQFWENGDGYRILKVAKKTL